MLTLSLAFAGIWHLLVDYMGLFALAGVLIAAAIFSTMIPIVGPLLTALRADLLWAAAVIIACLLWGLHIQHDTNLAWQAKQAVLDKAVEKIVTQTAPKPTKPHKAPYDRWDNRRN